MYLSVYPNIFTAYPMGLPVWDTVRLTIKGLDGSLLVTYISMDDYDFIGYSFNFIHHSFNLLFTAYPMGLPVWDTVRLTIEGLDGLEGTAAGMLTIALYYYIC
jgi:hypothetical protein